MSNEPTSRPRMTPEELNARLRALAIIDPKKLGREDGAIWREACTQAAEIVWSTRSESGEEKFIRCVWVVEREFGYGKAMRVVASNHPRFAIGSRFDFGFLNIAVDEGYRVQIDPVPPHVLHDTKEARRERKQAQR